LSLKVRFAKLQDYVAELQALLSLASKIPESVTRQRLSLLPSFKALKKRLETNDAAVNRARSFEKHNPTFQAAITEAVAHLNDPEGIERSRDAIEEALKEFERRQRKDDTEDNFQ
jgi:hypothetical protein